MIKPQEWKQFSRRMTWLVVLLTVIITVSMVLISWRGFEIENDQTRSRAERQALELYIRDSMRRLDRIEMYPSRQNKINDAMADLIEALLINDRSKILDALKTLKGQ